MDKIYSKLFKELRSSNGDTRKLYKHMSKWFNRNPSYKSNIMHHTEEGLNYLVEWGDITDMVHIKVDYQSQILQLIYKNATIAQILVHPQTTLTTEGIDDAVDLPHSFSTYTGTFVCSELGQSLINDYINLLLEAPREHVNTLYTAYRKFK